MKISILTASYNYANYIVETIESVLNQTYQDWELIIVDDGSKDNSVEVIKQYCQKDNRISLFQHKNKENRGLPETLKLGVSKCSSNWVVFLESDDKITSDYLMKKVEIIKKYPEVNLIFNDVEMFGDKETINDYSRKYFVNQREILSKCTFPTSLKKEFIKFEENIIPTFSTVLVKKVLLENIDWDSPIKQFIDYYIWLQLINYGSFYYINQKLTNWRIHNNSYLSASCTPKQKFEFDKNVINILYDDKPLYKILKTFKIFCLLQRRNIIQIKFSKIKNKKEMKLFNRFFINLPQKHRNKTLINSNEGEK